MSDYISREAALKVFCQWCGICPEEKRKPLECDDILGNVLRSLPAADVRPAVRCRECKHYRESPSQTSDNAVVVWCAADKYPHNDVMPDDWYCAAGEREEYNHE